jgi:RND family efflux transporter MFP subunit
VLGSRKHDIPNETLRCRDAGLLGPNDVLRLLLISVCLSAGLPVRAQSPEPVDVVEATMAPVYEELPLSGSVTTPRLSRLSPKVAGLVQRVYVEEGDEVRAGDALLVLDKKLAEIDLASAAAAAREAEARHAEAERQRREAEELVAKKHVSRSAFEAAAAEVGVSKAVLQRLRQELRRQEQLLEWHTVYAPFDGVMASKLVEAGEWVATGTPLFELAAIDLLRVDIPVPQYYLSQVQEGTRVQLRFDALPDRYFEGQVSIIVPIGNQNTRTFPIRIDVDNSDRVIAPGMSARAFLRLQQSGPARALLVPRDAIVRRADGAASVWVIQDEGKDTKVAPVSVRTGRSYRDNIEILPGDVQAGDLVVVHGNEGLREGQLVRVKERIGLKL